MSKTATEGVAHKVRLSQNPNDSRSMTTVTEAGMHKPIPQRARKGEDAR